MGRRTRRRSVKRTPENFYFTNFGDNISVDDEFVKLNISEFEAMRLKHYINLNQKESAEKMGISQPTFSRILENAHQKTTRALIEGKQIRVFGGNIRFKKGFIGYGCLECNNEWEDETASKDKKNIECPKCQSKKVYYLVREPI
ncbi:MAG: DUF134 domain-containing protein [Candidatus Lokiarchaeota archaeon]|nr:DUF134 domain-containing protein [Candidatus Lokiarchaeota archaeon]